MGTSALDERQIPRQPVMKASKSGLLINIILNFPSIVHFSFEIVLFTLSSNSMWANQLPN